MSRPTPRQQSHARRRPRLHAPALRPTARCIGLTLALVGLPALGGCAGLGNSIGLGRASADQPLAPMPSGRLATAEIEAELALSQRELDAELYTEGARRALLIREARDLEPEQRNRVEELLELGVRGLAETATRSSEMERLRPQDLPRRARAIQATAKARLLLDESKPGLAFETLRQFELVHPAHSLRAEAAELVYRAGVQLYESKARTLLIFKKRDRAAGVFDYLVLQHPSFRDADDAYFRLSELHRDARNLPRAIDRLEDLLVFHPDSSHALEAESLIPRLRLANQERYDYDRGNLERARDELLQWLQRHGPGGTAPAPDLEPTVRAALGACTDSLIRADLATADFYREVERPEGMRLAAARAAEQAARFGHAELEATALAWLREADRLIMGDAVPTGTVGADDLGEDQDQDLDFGDVERGAGDVLDDLEAVLKTIDAGIQDS